MQNLRRPNSIIACTAALALAGCSFDIEATDLSAIASENDRAVIEKALGKPDEVVEAQGLTVASYTYDIGYHAPELRIPHGHYGLAGFPVLFAAIAEASDQAAMTRKVRPQQKGQLAAVYDADQKLVFAGFQEGSDSTPKALASIAARFTEAQSGDAEALVDLGKVTLIPGQQKKFLQTAFDSGSAEAAFELGELYKLGAGVEQSVTRALEWWRKSASQHHVPAYIQIANAYRFGNGVPRDAGEAKVWLTKAAEGGDLKAQNILLEITGSEKRFETLLARAEDGHPAFQIEVADSYRFGIDVPKDIDLAIRMYERAAAAKNDYAAYALGKIYADGETGISNLSRAFMWYSIAEQIASGDEEELYRLKDELSEAMTPTRIAEAERMAREWMEQHRI